ncbi:MAG: thiamine pyrophosphate-dependent dehydrogenase E1 component subunit alpha [Malacoplasma sp.]
MLINKYDKKTEVYSVLDFKGNISNKSYIPSLSKEEIRKALYLMKLSRKLDEKMLQMQRQGRMLTFPPNMGEEALQVATGFGMDKNDYLVPAFRSGAIFLTLGVPIWQMMLLWNGNEMGNQMPEGINVIPVNIPIGTQYSHAMGIGMALKYNQKNNVAVSFIGDGGTAEGEFYEAMNFAAVRNTQTVFCINNNQWAISTPTHKESKNTDLAIKAIAAGIPYIKVDGNDLFASYDAFCEAKEYALKNGPILIEFLTYRQGPHTTSDNPKIYRTEAQEKEGMLLCPIFRLQKWMLDNNIVTQFDINKIEAKIDEDILAAIKIMEPKLSVSIDEVFDYTYKVLDKDLLEQKEECKKIFGEK